MSFLAKLEEDLRLARAAQASSRYEDGLAITRNYVGPTSRNRDFLHVHAQLLQGLSRFEEADPYYERLLDLDPGMVIALCHRAEGLRCIGRNEQAARLIADARPQYPHHSTLFGFHLCNVLRDEGPAAAIAVLAAEKQAPEPCRNWDSAVEIFRQKLLSLNDPDEVRALDPENLLGLSGSGSSGTYVLREIYEQFESLGANCDFGFVQRRRGAEPLSLLRWTSVTPSNLVRLLAANLEQYDDASRYSLIGAHEREYILREDVYETMAHTGVNQADVPADELLQRLTRRQTFLRRKFLAELSAGEKIFLYKAKDQISEEEMAAIEQELTRLGARRTMFTMLTDDAAQVGTVVFPTPSRAIGYLSRRPPEEKMEEWDRVVVKAFDHFMR